MAKSELVGEPIKLYVSDAMNIQQVLIELRRHIPRVETPENVSLIRKTDMWIAELEERIEAADE